MQLADRRRLPLLADRAWPIRPGLALDITWGAFATANAVAIYLLPRWETIPFHFIWVSLTLLYGFRVWALRPTMWVLGAVILVTGLLIGYDIHLGAQPPDELSEVPLMSAMFVAMVWHARRRHVAMRRVQEVSEDNLHLLEREQRFIQDASHELRTPITVALGHAELVQRGAGDPVVAEDAQVVVDELMRLRRLADRLLLLAASESGDFLSMAAVEVEPIVVDAVRRWTPTPRRWLLGDIDEATVEADPDRLALAVDAVIENAVKHTGPEDTITLSVVRDAGSVRIAIADTGTGIPPERLDRVFDRFGRGDDGRGRRRGGMGLGLAIVRAIVEAHGGAVSVRSSPGRGSAFELRLPLAGTGRQAVATEAGASPGRVGGAPYPGGR